MKATINKQVSNGLNYGYKKEKVATFIALAITDKGIQEVIDARCYMGRSSSASTVYASIWVNGNDTQTSGHGQAGGYGYDKHSSAIGYAIKSAGIELSENIDARGTSAIREALKAIAQAIGFDNVYILEA